MGRTLGVLAAGLALSTVAGCADPDHPPVRQTSSSVEPELAGAWYHTARPMN